MSNIESKTASTGGSVVLRMSPLGTFRKCWVGLTMSVPGGKPEVPFKRGHFRF
jgi:hypothetical protein